MRFPAFISCLVWCVLAFGQPATAPTAGGRAWQKVTLADGTVYVGVPLAENDLVLMLQTADGNRVQVQKDDIAARAFATVAEVPDTAPAKNQEATMQADDGRFGMQIEVGGGTSFSRNSYGWVPAMQAAWVLGVRDVAWTGTFAGVGIGYHLCLADRSDEGPIHLLPLFARLHSTIGRHVTAPYVELDAGYTFSFHPDINGGMLLRLSAGVARRFSSRTAFYAGVYGSLQGLSGNLRDIDPWGDYFTYHGHTLTQQAGVKVALRF